MSGGFKTWRIWEAAGLLPSGRRRIWAEGPPIDRSTDVVSVPDDCWPVMLTERELRALAEGVQLPSFLTKLNEALAACEGGR